MVVKGTTLKEFDEVKSFKKKIRESYCKQVLKDVATGGKVKLRKVLDEINAKEVPVTGRIGKEMVILRTVK
jgi:radical SAM superfamily enzyme with C-terminal helix-hairpin-helix motif